MAMHHFGILNQVYYITLALACARRDCSYFMYLKQVCQKMYCHLKKIYFLLWNVFKYKYNNMIQKLLQLSKYSWMAETNNEIILIGFLPNNLTTKICVWYVLQLKTVEKFDLNLSTGCLGPKVC